MRGRGDVHADRPARRQAGVLARLRRLLRAQRGEGDLDGHPRPLVAEGHGLNQRRARHPARQPQRRPRVRAAAHRRRRLDGFLHPLQDAALRDLPIRHGSPACDPGAQQVFASILTAPPGPTISELLPKVKHPVLVIWGADDPWTPVTGAKIFQQWNQNGQPIEFVSIPNTGHCPHDERPDVVNPLMLNWLAKLR